MIMISKRTKIAYAMVCLTFIIRSPHGDIPGSERESAIIEQSRLVMNEGQPDMSMYLQETEHLDYRHPAFDEVLARVVSRSAPICRRLEQLFYFTRDVLPFMNSAHLQASDVLKDQRGICYTKAMVYAAFCRKLGIPAKFGLLRFRIREDSVKNRQHVHGIVKIFVNDKWIYIDTVSNRDAWDHWGIRKTVTFEAPRFTCQKDVIVSSKYYDKMSVEEYDSPDVPEEWLIHMQKYLKTGKW